MRGKCSLGDQFLSIYRRDRSASSVAITAGNTSKHWETKAMWIALLLLTWGVEGVAGGWFCYHYWIFPGIHYGASTFFIGPGNAVVSVVNALTTTLFEDYAPHRHPPVLTQEGLAHFLIAVYVAAHVL